MNGTSKRALDARRAALCPPCTVTALVIGFLILVSVRPVAAQPQAIEPSVFRVRGIAVPTPNGEQRGLSSDSLPSRDLQWSPATTKGAQMGLNFGLLQLGLGGFNVATETRYRRLWLEYSHGMLLTLNNLGGFGLTQPERDQKLHIRVPFTTGFGVGFTVAGELWLGAEFKAHGYEVNAPGGPVSHYRTYSIGPVLGYKYYIWNGLYADAYGRYWPNVVTSLDGGKVALVGNQGTVEHTAHDFGLFGNVSLGYMFRR
jgi:hypothetical protein